MTTFTLTSPDDDRILAEYANAIPALQTWTQYVNDGTPHCFRVDGVPVFTVYADNTVIEENVSFLLMKLLYAVAWKSRVMPLEEEDAEEEVLQ